MRRRGLIAVAVFVALVAAPSAFAAAKDSDKDGLPDKWEKATAPGGLSLKKLGANPKHRDVFVELDYGTGVTKADITCASLDTLYDAFKNAPLSNPDKKTGVKLHIDAGKRCPSRKYDSGGSSRFKTTSPCASPLDLNNSIKEKRLKVFHLGGIVRNADLCGAEGIAFGADFMVQASAGTFFSHVVLHELGHVFGLDHGTVNSFSVMAKPLYKYPSGQQIVDFNRYPIAALDETSLSEPAGLQSTAKGETFLLQMYLQRACVNGTLGFIFVTPSQGGVNVDWDCDAFPYLVPLTGAEVDADPVSADVNGDGAIGVIPAAKPEWPLLKFGRGRIGP